jgi:hypothetical protein
MNGTVKMDGYQGWYSLEPDEDNHTWSVYFHHLYKSGETEAVATDLLTFRDAELAKSFHNIDRLKAALIGLDGQI